MGKIEIMGLKYSVFALLMIMLCFTGCSKKEHSQTAAVTAPVNKTAEVKPVAKKTVKMPLPGVITVDDRAAKKTPDGRMYYDYEGRRYWRNYNDGKYYLFNKGMYNDPAFKPH